MMIEVEAPDGTIVEFPEGTPREVMQDAMRRRFPQTQPQQPQEESPRAASIRREMFALGPDLGPPDMRMRPSESRLAMQQQAERQRGVQELQLEQEGVRIGEAPVEARVKSGLGISRAQGYQSALGPDYQVREIKSEGPLQGEVVFRKEGEQGWTTVRDPSPLLSPMDFGARARDIQSLQYSAIPEAIGAAGGALGAASRFPGVATRPLLMAPTLGGLARFYAETKRMQEGRRQGIITPDISDAEINAVALNEAFGQAIGEFGGVVLYSAFKGLRGRGLPDLGDLTPVQLQAGIDSLKQKLGPEGAKLITIGDILSEIGHPAASIFKSGEEKAARTSGAMLQPDFANRLAAKEQFSGQQLQQVIPEGATPARVDVEQLGRSVEAAAPGIEEFGAATRAVPGAQPPSSAANLGERVVQTLRDAERAGQEAIQKVYQRLSGTVGDVGELPTATGKTIEEMGKDFGTRIFPSLSDDQKKLVADAGRTLYRETPGGFLPDDEVFTPGGRELKEISFLQYQKAISDIRRAIRLGYKGEWSGELGQLDTLERALIADRDRLLMKTMGPDSVKELNDADAGWAALKNTFRRAKLAEAFKVSPKLARSETSEDFLGDLSMDFDTAQAVKPYLQGRELAEVRGMLMLQLSELGVAYGRGREIRQGVLERAINASDSPIGVFFNQAERKGLNSGAKLQEIRKAIGVADRQDFGSWFDSFYSAKNIGQADALYRRLASNPANAPVADAIRSMVRQRVYDDLSTKGSQNVAKVLDVDKFESLVRDPRQLQWLERSLGPDFAARLGMVSEATRALFPAGQRVNLGAETKAASVTMEAIRRGSRAVVGVLSPKARALTYALNVANADMKQRIARAVLDPEYFTRLMRQSRSTAGGRVTATTLGAALNENEFGDTNVWWSDLPGKWSENVSRMMPQ
jgi:hypothetical protein